MLIDQICRITTAFVYKLKNAGTEILGDFFEHERVGKLIFSALRFLTFSWWTIFSGMLLLCTRTRIRDSFLPKSFFIWLNFLAVCLEFSYKRTTRRLDWRKFIAEICLDLTSSSYQGLPRFDENFFPKYALIWRKCYHFFLAWDDASVGRNFLGDLEVKTFLKSCWSLKAWNCWNMRYFQQFCQIKQNFFTLLVYFDF